MKKTENKFSRNPLPGQATKEAVKVIGVQADAHMTRIYAVSPAAFFAAQTAGKEHVRF